MGKTIQFESHRVEFAVALEMEEDTSVFEYYDQPCRIRRCRPDASRQNSGTRMQDSSSGNSPIIVARSHGNSKTGRSVDSTSYGKPPTPQVVKSHLPHFTT